MHSRRCKDECNHAKISVSLLVVSSNPGVSTKVIDCLEAQMLELTVVRDWSQLPIGKLVHAAMLKT